MRILAALALLSLGCKGNRPTPPTAEPTAAASVTVAPSASAPAATAPAADAAAPEAPLRHAMGVAFGGNKAEIAQARAEVEKLRAAASNEERPFFDRLLRLYDAIETVDMADFAKARETLAQVQSDCLALLRDWAKAAPKDSELRRMYVANLHAAGFMADEKAGTTRRKEAFNEAKKLVADFPNDGAVHSLYGALCMTEIEDRALCARTFLRCLELTPADAYCKKAYKEIVEEIAGEQCAAPKPGVSFREAFRKPQLRGDVDRTTAKGLVAMTTKDGDEVFVSPKVILAASDFKRIAPSEVTITESEPITVPNVEALQSAMASSMKDPPRTTTRVAKGTRFVIAPGKREAVKTWARESRRDQQTVLALVEGTTLLYAARAMGVEDSFFLEGIELAAVCKKTVKPPLPADLKPASAIGD